MLFLELYWDCDSVLYLSCEVFRCAKIETYSTCNCKLPCQYHVRVCLLLVISVFGFHKRIEALNAIELFRGFQNRRTHENRH